MQTKSILLILIILAISATVTHSQNANNILLFNNQATLFGDQGPASDPVSIVMPGTAINSGLGTFLDNPASVALFDESFGEFGLSFRSIDEESTYLGNTQSLDHGGRGVSNAGFVYSFPTKRGSLVFGAAYAQHSIYTRAFGFGTRNERSSITDAFKYSGSPYQEIAFNTFATDYGDEFQDWDESIFRIGFDEFGDFLGTRQQGEVTRNGVGGEYSLFLATEFQKNFMVGASIGLISGNFSYDRIFQEVDNFNDYNFDVIDVDEDGTPETDIDNILLDDNLESSYTGFRARAGLLYRINDKVNLGFSYTLPTVLFIDEDFDATVITTFDNSVEFEDATESTFSYEAKYPGRFALGLGVQDLSGITLSLSAEYVDHSATEIRFDESDLFEDELIENDFIQNNFRETWSYRAGLAYELNPLVNLRAGYGFFPSRFEEGGGDRTAYSAGVGVKLGNGLTLEAAAQYLTLEETSTVYEYADYNYSPLPENPPAVSFDSEVANRNADRLQVLATIRVALN